MCFVRKFGEPCAQNVSDPLSLMLIAIIEKLKLRAGGAREDEGGALRFIFASSSTHTCSYAYTALSEPPSPTLSDPSIRLP